MNRLIWSISIGFFALSVGACALETDAGPTAEAPAMTAVAEVRNEPLPQAIAPATAGGPEDALVLPVAYACEGGRAFTAAFPADGQTVRIAAAGETRVLPHRDAADTVMYSDGAVTLTADGAEATLSGLDGLYAGCMAG